ncbi:FMN-binding negative transcriptional regulator [Thalassotalea sp. 1_MG-2023]|uniref:FMN-binding negative transcriptional regulator n=1 Tax=Thalassotalea sp. 1_MG-2023 TaxID=3062680 RepID=UPI0026E2F530|nr:FMN-binding negative transcriptional regulator [Thalassotalea sp. 1_MG-2023]MDO6425655.1 FMN-binding negative transcriptional regulator [Thalassotalea sp. 1_MG-2023]
MYVPSRMQFPAPSLIDNFLHKYSFVTLVSPSLQATRLPLYYDQEKQRLIGHFSRANPHWKEVAQGPCLAIFDGPHEYISPTWYNKPPNVPTWNYASVHVKGKVTLLDDVNTVIALDKLMEKYEPSLLEERDVVTPEYQEKLLKGIVGFSMTIDHIDAKAKLGQHRSDEDQKGVTNGLSETGTLDSQALLALMIQWQVGLGTA